MNISNFKRLGVGSDGVEYAEVTTKSFAWTLPTFSKTEIRTVFRLPYHAYWRWLDDNNFTPGYQVESLERIQKAQAVINTLKK